MAEQGLVDDGIAPREVGVLEGCSEAAARGRTERLIVAVRRKRLHELQLLRDPQVDGGDGLRYGEELVVPPALDPVDLGRVKRFQFCRRHSAALHGGDGVTRLFVH